MCALVQAVCERAGASTSESAWKKAQMIMDLMHDVDNVTARVKTLETYKSQLEEYKTTEKNQITALFDSDNYRRNSIEMWKITVQTLGEKLDGMTKKLDETTKKLDETRDVLFGKQGVSRGLLEPRQ